MNVFQNTITTQSFLHCLYRCISVVTINLILYLAKVCNTDKDSCQVTSARSKCNHNDINRPWHCCVLCNYVCSPTTEFFVVADDVVGSLGGMEETLPGQGIGVAQLGIVVQQD